MPGQRWPDDIKRQALALALVDGVKLASDVTQVPERTVRSWVAGGNGRQDDDADHQESDQQVSPVAPVSPLPEPEAKRAELLAATGDPARELVRDLHLARRVFRVQAEAFLDGRVSSATYRNASVALGIMEDKANKRGLPGARGGEWTWEQNHAQAQASLVRIKAMVAMIAERASAGNVGDPDG